jgi:hypothetical protein
VGEPRPRRMGLSVFIVLSDLRYDDP